MIRVCCFAAISIAICPLAISADSPTLIVEEHRICSKEVDTPDHFEFGHRIDKAILEKRRLCREAPYDKWSVSYMNAGIKPLGYELIQQSANGMTYDLHRDGKPIVRNLHDPQHFAIDDTGKRFAFMASQTVGKTGYRYVLCCNGIARRWDNRRIGPIFLNGELLHIQEIGLEPSGKKYIDRHKFEVKNGEKTLYAFTAEESVTDTPIKSFFSWRGAWVVEYRDNVVANGVNLREKNGYSKMFSYCLVEGKPFYFFEKDGKIGISFDGRTLPYVYEEVVHYQCCEPAHFNAMHNDSMVWFYALKDGFWHYVEAGVYEKP